MDILKLYICFMLQLYVVQVLKVRFSLGTKKTLVQGEESIITAGDDAVSPHKHHVVSPYHHSPYMSGRYDVNVMWHVKKRIFTWEKSLVIYSFLNPTQYVVKQCEEYNMFEAGYQPQWTLLNESSILNPLNHDSLLQRCFLFIYWPWWSWDSVNPNVLWTTAIRASETADKNVFSGPNYSNWMIWSGSVLLSFVNCVTSSGKKC